LRVSSLKVYLSGRHAEARGQAEEEPVVLGQLGGGDGGVVLLGGGVHLGEDLGGEGLGDLKVKVKVRVKAKFQ
jgi:hypothetical protein